MIVATNAARLRMLDGVAPFGISINTVQDLAIAQGAHPIAI
jgi:hypothetical protein